MGRSSLIRLAALLLPFGYYLYNAAAGIYWEDTAAFQTAASELGIVHNPSFPIFILLAKLFTMLPFGSAAFLVNVCSAFFAALAAFVLFNIALLLARTCFGRVNRYDEFIALMASLVFALSYSAVLQAVRAEVYSLNTFSVLLVIWLALKFYRGEINSLRFAAIIGLICGLASANHYLLFAVVVFPILLLVLAVRRHILFRWRELAVYLSFLLIGLSVYIYLPIREAFAPTFNWGDFSTFAATLKSILRFDEALPIVVNGVVTPFGARLVSVTSAFVDSLSLVVIIASVAGLVLAYRRQRLISLILLLPLFSSLLVTAYAANFSPYNLDLFGYMQIAAASAALLCFVTLVMIARKLIENYGRVVGNVVTGATAIVLIILVIDAHPQSVNRRHFRAADYFATNMLESLPERALFIAGEDNSFSPLLYKQQVDGLRRDVIVVSGGALLRSDYRRKIKERYPCLHYPHNWNERGFVESFPQNFTDWLFANDKKYPVYLTLSSWTSPLISYLRPHGFAYSLSRESMFNNDLAAISNDFYSRHTPLWRDSNDLTTKEYFGRLLYNYAVFNLRHQQANTAVHFTHKAIEADPTNPDLLYSCAGLLAATDNIDQAHAVLGVALMLDPDNTNARRLLETLPVLTMETAVDDQN